jgi:ABC-type uncharacterized transport system substrate-binding protein
MWTVIRRLLLGFALILFASALLLIFDRHQRRSVAVDDASIQKETRPESGTLRPPPDGRHFTVGLVYFAPEPGADACMAGLFGGLTDLGFVEGKNLQLRKTHAQGEIVNIPAILQNFANQDVDLISP